MKLIPFTVLAAALVSLPLTQGFADGPFVPFHNYGGTGPGTIGVSVYPSAADTREARIQAAILQRYGGSANTLVQAQLTELGYYHGPIDGNVSLGTRTATAIADYQRDHRMPVTGAINGGLIASLNR